VPHALFLHHVHYDDETHNSLVIDLGAPGDGLTADLDIWLADVLP
jgi:hypothetical protein